MSTNAKIDMSNKKAEFRMKADDYQEHTLREHIYNVTDSYIGSDERIEKEETLYDYLNKKMFKSKVDVPEGLERLFLEIISNAGDNADRSIRNNVDPGMIEVRMDGRCISVKNGGVPIPVEKNVKGIYVPEMIFGQLLTSSNYSNNKERTGCGRNGYGAKLTNIFSEQFMVEIGDANNGLKYNQVWNNNMTVKGSPILNEYKGESYVLIVYKADLKRFGYEVYPDEVFQLFARRAADISLTCKVPVLFNGVKIDTRDIKEYARLYYGESVKNSIVHYQWPKGVETVSSKRGLVLAKDKNAIPIIEICAVDTPDNGVSISFANGMCTLEGGIHVERAYKALAGPILEIINNSGKTKVTGKKRKKKRVVKSSKKRQSVKLKVSDFKKHVSLFISVRVVNAKFNAQTKTQLKSVDSKHPLKVVIDPNILKSVSKWRLMRRLYAELDAQKFKLISNTDGNKSRYVNISKGEDANLAGTNNSHKCVLWIIEGNSASSYPNKLLSYFGKTARDFIGIYIMKGKPLNVKNAPAQQIAENQEITDLKSMLGLRENTDYSVQKAFNTLRYGQICIIADSDVDGKHILGLIINLFHCRYPSLLSCGFVKYMKTPTHRVTVSRKCYKFYSQHEYDVWMDKHKPKKFQVDYFKGLGTSSDEHIRDDAQKIRYVQTIYDKDAPDKLELAFNNKLSNLRKEWIANWKPDHSVETLEKQPISLFVDHELIQFSIDDLKRSIPKFMDGLKISQRKIIWGSMIKWGSNVGKNSARKIKVAQLASFCAGTTNYHHGEKCLSDTIINMAQNFVGANNMIYFKQDSQFGTRNMGGKDAADARYSHTRPEWWWPYIFVKDDASLYKMVVDEGEECEPECFYPIIPLQLINGAKGIGTGHSTFIPNHNPIDVCNWLLERIKGKRPGPIIPWYKGFNGTLKITYRKRNSKQSTTKECNPEHENNPENEQNSELSDDELLGADDEYDDYTKPIKMSLLTCGKFEVTGNVRKKITITELPIGRFIHNYNQWLTKIRHEGLITSFKNYSQHNTVHFEVFGLKNPSERALRLNKSFGLTNMVLLNTNDRPEKFNSTQHILEEFYQRRLPIYQQRKNLQITQIQDKIDKYQLKAQFIDAVRSGLIPIKNRRKDEIYIDMDKHKLPHYLLEKVGISSLTSDEYNKLQQQIHELQNKKQELEKIPIAEMWTTDLNKFLDAYCKINKCTKTTKNKFKLNIIKK